MDEQSKPTVTVEARCGNCAMWREVKASGPIADVRHARRGLCNALPPTPAVRFKDGQIAGQTNLRPMTRPDEFCMAFFIPLAMSE